MRCYEKHVTSRISYHRRETFRSVSHRNKSRERELSVSTCPAMQGLSPVQGERVEISSSSSNSERTRPEDRFSSIDRVSPAKVNRIRFARRANTHLSMFGWLSLFMSWTSLSMFGLFAGSWFILSTITWLVTLWVTWKTMRTARLVTYNVTRGHIVQLLTLDHTRQVHT